MSGDHKHTVESVTSYPCTIGMDEHLWLCFLTIVYTVYLYIILDLPYNYYHGHDGQIT